MSQQSDFEKYLSPNTCLNNANENNYNNAVDDGLNYNKLNSNLKMRKSYNYDYAIDNSNNHYFS